MRLRDKITIITGAAKGLGRDVTLALAEEGAHLVMVGRDVDALQGVAEEVAALGRRVEVVKADLREPGEVAAMVHKARDFGGGRIDVLVNAAGVSARDPVPLWDQPVEDFARFFDTNVKGVFLTMKYVLPTMIGQKSGRIVNVGGTFGHRGVEGNSLYAASKWALRGVTKSAAVEAGRHGVGINIVAPGGVEGPSFDGWLAEEAARRDIAPAAMFDRFVSGAAMRRLSRASDIANAIVFLASDASRNITGHDLLVDGGTIM
ncbi:MAG: SDR family oxidoreductase [Phreatobacter sp.]|nr:SDR family oxidoreductase [Phreatobacter sp.]